jgi:serine/threonine protein kinase
LGKPYNESSDVYSFAILFWEMLALKQPYQLYTMSSLRERVWNAPHKRPCVDASWSVSTKLLLKRAWSPNIEERHKMGNIEGILRKECVACRNGDDRGLEHYRRRSTFVFRKDNIPIDHPMLGDSNTTAMTL